MTRVEISESGFVVDAKLLAEAFKIDAADVQSQMKSGAITSVCEQGVDADEGRWRLTFYHDNRALRLTVDQAGCVLSQSRFDAPRRSIRAAR